eukprot:PhF_6_TR42693/c0_g1_i1/m.64427
MDLSGAWTSVTHAKTAKLESKVMSVWQCSVLMTRRPDWVKLRPSLQLSKSIPLAVTYREGYWNGKGFDGIKGLRYERIRSRLSLRFEDMNSRVASAGGASVNIPMRRQVTMSTDDSLLFENRRQLARYHASVRKIVDDWWKDLPKDSRGSLVQSTHHWITQQLYGLLVVDGNAEEEGKLKDEDWKCDSKGCISMDSLLFHQMAMQFCDVWCETTELKEFVEFLSVCREACQGAPPIEDTSEADNVQYIHQVLSTSLLRGGIRVTSLTEEVRSALGGLGTFVRALTQDDIHFPENAFGGTRTAEEFKAKVELMDATSPKNGGPPDMSEYGFASLTRGFEFDFVTFCAFIEASYSEAKKEIEAVQTVTTKKNITNFKDPAELWIKVYPRETIIHNMEWEVSVDGVWHRFSPGVQEVLKEAFEATSTIYMDELGDVYIRPWTFESSAGPLRCVWRYRWECLSASDGKTWIPYPMEMQANINAQFETQRLADTAHDADDIPHPGGGDGGVVEKIDFVGMCSTTVAKAKGAKALPRRIRSVEVMMDKTHFDAFEETIVTLYDRPTRDPCNRTERESSVPFLAQTDIKLLPRTLKRPSMVPQSSSSSHDTLGDVSQQPSILSGRLGSASRSTLRFPLPKNTEDLNRTLDVPTRVTKLCKQLHEEVKKNSLMVRAATSFSLMNGNSIEGNADDDVQVMSLGGRKIVRSHSTVPPKRASSMIEMQSPSDSLCVHPKDHSLGTVPSSSLPALRVPPGTKKSNSTGLMRKNSTTVTSGSASSRMGASKDRGVSFRTKPLTDGMCSELFRVVDFPVYVPAGNLRLLQM